MDHGVAALESGTHGVRVGDVGDHDLDGVGVGTDRAQRAFDPVGGADEEADLVSGLLEGGDGVAADVAGTSGDGDLHRLVPSSRPASAAGNGCWCTTCR